MAANKSLTTKILIWMTAGLVLGVLINLTIAEVSFIQNFIIQGVLKVGGSLFIKALKMLVVPLVTFSLISGVLGIGDIKTLGRVGAKSLALYLATTAIAITSAVVFASFFNPGRGFDLQSAAATQFAPKEAPSLSQVFIDLIPGNPVSAYANGEMLQIIFFTILFAVCLVLSGDKGRRLAQGAESLNGVMMNMVTLIMSLAPYGVFCLMAKTFSEQGLALLVPMLGYFSLVVTCLLIHLYVTMPLIFKLFTGLNPVTFLRKIRTAQVFAFSTASSNATIPATLRSVEERMGVDNSVASFTIPFGATINMDGTAIMQGVATIFIANVYGIDLNLTQYLTVIGVAVLASIGTAGVPGVGLIMLAMVFHQVGLPVEGIGLILGVDRLLDMIRTAVNITGDAAVTCIVAKSEGKMNLKTFLEN